MRAFLPLCVAVSLLACSPAVPDDSWADCGGAKCDGAGEGASRLSAPSLLVNDLAVLGKLEASGLGLGQELGGDGASARSLDASSAAYHQIVRTLGSDLAELAAQDPLAGVGLAPAHRLFDARWLKSSAVRFRLVAVVNRTDRLHATPGRCGEVRLIYRMQYTSPQGSSRLPMTLMVVHEQAMEGSDCAPTARRWLAQSGSAQALLAGPLASLGPVVRVETNLQSVRWPALVRPDMGGSAEYLLRVFAASGAPIALPGTIAGNLSASKKQALAQWIRDNLAAIDRGTAQVPPELLATRATSASPRGLARGANRPFLAAFPRPEETFAGLDLAGLGNIRSPGGLVRRLDTMTCQGCHQTRGMAGFHLLGEDDGLEPGNVIAVGSSPHLNDELRWRQRALEALVAGQTPEPEPMADRDPTIPGRYGAHCGLGDPSFAAWTCAAGFTCADLDGDEVGMCVPADGPGAGDACETSSVTFSTSPRADRVIDMQVQACSVPAGEPSCSRSIAGPDAVGGFPTGSCTGACATMGLTGGDATCGATPPSGFNACLAAGKPFATCMSTATPAFRRRCDAHTPCGNDYVCAGVAGAPAGVGACMPPYFIFQARVDGHKVP